MNYLKRPLDHLKGLLDHFMFPSVQWAGGMGHLSPLAEGPPQKMDRIPRLLTTYQPMKSSLCTLCRLSGHNRRTCPQRDPMAPNAPNAPKAPKAKANAAKANAKAPKANANAAKANAKPKARAEEPILLDDEKDPGAVVEADEKKEPPALHASTWTHCRAFQELRTKETQPLYYAKNGAAPPVMTLVTLDSKPFGSVGEKMLREVFQLGPRTSSQNDGTRGKKKLEIKCARYWAGSDDCKWQHLEPDHDYDAALLALLTFDGWRVWVISKARLMALREQKIVSDQGVQGYWVKKSDLLPYLTEVQSAEELDAALE